MQKLYTQRNRINEPCSCGDGGGKFAAMAQGSLTALARAPDDAQAVPAKSWSFPGVFIKPDDAPAVPKGNAQATPAKSGRYAGMFKGAA